MVWKRGEVYYLRLHVPTDLQPEVGRREIVKSLHTGRRREASTKAGSIKNGAEIIWKRLRAMKRQLSNEQIKALVDKWLEQELQEYCDPLCAPLWLTSSKNNEQFEFLIDELHNRKYRLADAVRAPQSGYGVSSDHDALCEGLPFDGPEFNACREVAAQLIEQQGVGQVDEESQLIMVRHIAHAMLQVTDTQINTAREVYGLPALSETTQPEKAIKNAANAAPLLSEVLAERLVEVIQNRAEKTARTFKGQIPFLLKLLGDKPVDQYVRADFVAAQGILQKWPRNANSKAPEATIEEVLSRTDLGPPLQDVQKYLILMSTVFNYAVNAGHLDKSLVPKWPTKKHNCADGKPAFNDEQLHKLFSSPHYTNKAVKIKKPHNYWIPLIALHTGMRIDEICQLYVADVIECAGVWCFDVNRKADKKLKTQWCARLVPIHSKLVSLGFIRYVEKMQAEGHERLWPILRLGKNGYSTAFGKNINKYLKLWVTGDAKGKPPTFHSLRKNFATALEAAGVDDSTVAKLLGHEPANKTLNMHYQKLDSDGKALKLKPVIEKLDFEATQKLD